MAISYTGSEHLLFDGQELSFTMLDFWKWGYSNLLHNLQRGSLAEFIVNSALLSDNSSSCHLLEHRNSIEPYDLLGPVIKSTGNQARIEVKSAAYVQIWDERNPGQQKKVSFSIAPAKVPDETGDYPSDAKRQRNNDIYVFCVYAASDRSQNILDLTLWKFYVLPTFVIESEDNLAKLKHISEDRLLKIGVAAIAFNNLSSKISECCDIIPADFVPRQFS